MDERGNGESGQHAVFDSFEVHLKGPLLLWEPPGEIIETPVPENDWIKGGGDSGKNIDHIQPAWKTDRLLQDDCLRQHGEASDERREGTVPEDFLESRLRWAYQAVLIPEALEIGKRRRHERGVAGGVLERDDARQFKGPGDTPKPVKNMSGEGGPITPGPQKSFPASSGDPHPDPAFSPVGRAGKGIFRSGKGMELLLSR